jgi:hypothetical protein
MRWRRRRCWQRLVRRWTWFCEQEHDPFRGVDNEDEDDDDEEPVPPRGDDESNLAVEPAIHNPDPAMEDLVEGLSRLSLRTS